MRDRLVQNSARLQTLFRGSVSSPGSRQQRFTDAPLIQQLISAAWPKIGLFIIRARQRVEDRPRVVVVPNDLDARPVIDDEHDLGTIPNQPAQQLVQAVAEMFGVSMP